MLANLLKFGELRVKDVMVPRADIIAVEEKTSLADLVMQFREAQHSRLPVYRETLDDPTGLVHLKNVLALLHAEGEGNFHLDEAPIAKIKRDILFAPPSMPALDLLLKMQTSHTHLALVIDEYGGTDGLVSIEDIIEEIVGDIADEHDEEAPRARRCPAAAISPMRASTSTISRTRRASICRMAKAKPISTRWAGWSCRCSAACRSAARSWLIPSGTNSRCSKPIRGASRSCAYVRRRRRQAVHR